MTPYEKRELAYSLKQSGKSVREIANTLGCSHHRANELTETHERHLWLIKSENKFVREIILVAGMTPGFKIVRIFEKMFGEIEKIDPLKIAGLGPTKVGFIKNIGPKLLRYIAKALESVGSIKSAKEWLALEVPGDTLRLNLNEKREYAYNLKKTGKTGEEIGREIGCGAQWALKLVETHERRLSFLSYENIFVRELVRISPMSAATQIIHCFEKMFGGIEEIDPHKIAKLGSTEVLVLDRIGPATARYIAVALESTGAIKSVQEWLAPAEKELIHGKTDAIIRWIVQNVTDDDIPVNTNNGKALMFNLVQLALYGKSYKSYNNDPDQDAQIQKLNRIFKKQRR